MAITLLTPQVLDFEEGVTPTFNAVNGESSGEVGNYFPNNGKVILIFRNENAAAQEITIKTPRQLEGLDIEEVSIVVLAGGAGAAATYQAVNGLPPKIFNQSNGTVEMVYGAGAADGADLKAVLLQFS